MKLLIADVQPLFHTAIRYLLRNTGLNLEFSSVYTAEQLFETLSKQTVDLLILDVCLNNFIGFRDVGYILNKYPNIRVLIFSNKATAVYAHLYLKLGAYGFIEKSSHESIFIEAVSQISYGRKYFTTEVFENLLSGRNYETKNPVSLLSERELEVIDELLKGKDLKEISAVMHISSSSVSTIKSRIFEKLGIFNLIELYKFYMEFLKS